MTHSPPLPLLVLAFGAACAAWVVLSVRKLQRSDPHPPVLGRRSAW